MEPKISVITPLYNTKKEFFVDYIDSLKRQTYSNFEVCLVDASEKELEYIHEIINDDDRIKYKRLESNNGISENSNEAIKMACGDYIAFIDHDDVIDESAFYEVIKKLNENLEIDFIYTDEDKFENNTDNRFYPFFKPDFSPDFLRSNNYICHLSIIRKSLLEKIGYFRKELAARMNLRHTPELRFIYDKSIAYGEHIDEIIEKINEKKD